MDKFLKNKTFKEGVSVGGILFLLAQAVSLFSYFISTLVLMLKTPPGISFHGFWDIGFPFSMYYGMYDIFHGDINFKGLAGNILFAIIFSLTVGVVFKVESRTKNLKRNQISIVGFYCGIVCFLSLNYYAFIQNYGLCFGCVNSFGFPLTFYTVGGGYITNTEISWNALIADILIAVIFSFYFGFISKFIWEKLITKKLR